MQAASSNVKRLSLELGGKSPSIILPDADLDLATDGVLFGIYMNGGQSCEAGARCSASRSTTRWSKAPGGARASCAWATRSTSRPTWGRWCPTSSCAPVLGYIEIGKQEGARLVTGGRRAEVPGFERAPFVEPTIFANVHNQMRIAQEIFGPVLAVIYRDVSEAIGLANRTIYGLGAAVWSRNIRVAIEVAKHIRAGTVWINDHHLIIPHATFNGMKQSGFGNRHGLAGYLDYTQAKHIHVDMMQRGEPGLVGCAAAAERLAHVGKRPLRGGRQSARCNRQYR